VGRKQQGIQQLYQTLSRRARARLLIAVSFIFAPAGILQAPELEGKMLLLLAWIVYSAALAVGWALSFIKDFRFLWLLIPLQIVVLALLNRWAPSALSLEDALCGGFIILGYVFLINFISDEGLRHVRLRAEIAVAEQIQGDLVPPVYSESETLQLFGRSVSCSEVGGDLLDVVEQDGQVGLYVADVTGHGVPASMLMSTAKGAIRMSLLSSPGLGSLFEDLNRVLYEISGKRMFVTLACLRIRADRTAEYALAGHPPILHYSAASRTVSRLSNPSLPLGAMKESLRRRAQGYESRQIELEPGDLLVLLTDGLTEVMNDEGDELGEERIEAIVAENAECPLPELHGLIMEAVARHGSQQDDQTLLMARILG